MGLRLSFGIGPVRVSGDLIKRNRKRRPVPQAPVSIRGTVTAHGPGTVTVRVISGDLSASINGQPVSTTVKVPRPGDFPVGGVVDVTWRRSDRSLLHIARVSGPVTR